MLQIAHTTNMVPIKDTSKTLEKQIERALKYRIERMGGICLKLKPYIKGTPDRLIIYNGHVYFVELKRAYGKGRLSDVQKDMISRLKRAGADVRILYGARDCNAFIEEIEQKQYIQLRL